MLRSAPLVVLCSCALMRSLPTGEPAPPKPDDCAIRQERLSLADADARYTQVGLICEQGPVSDGDVPLESRGLLDRQEFQRRACTLGGDVVIAAGFCPLGKVGGIEWHVYRERL